MKSFCHFFDFFFYRRTIIVIIVFVVVVVAFASFKWFSFFVTHSWFLVCLASGEECGEGKVIFGWITLEKRRHATRSGVRKRFFSCLNFSKFPSQFSRSSTQAHQWHCFLFYPAGGKAFPLFGNAFPCSFCFFLLRRAASSLFSEQMPLSDKYLFIYLYFHFFCSWLGSAWAAFLTHFFFFSPEWILIFIFYVFICLYRRLKFIWLLFTSSIWLHSDFSCCFIALEKFYFSWEINSYDDQYQRRKHNLIKADYGLI